jgi:hypothetical protein
MRFGISRKRLRLLNEFTKQSLQKEIIMIKYTIEMSVIIQKLQRMMQVLQFSSASSSITQTRLRLYPTHLRQPTTQAYQRDHRGGGKY